MRAKTSTWFETKVQYEKTMETGIQKKVVELYTTDAMSFTEAEARITSYAADYSMNSPEVATLKRADYADVFFSDKSDDDRWYKVKVAYITTDEKTGNEKRSYTNYLVQADNIDNANKYMKDALKGTLLDYVFESVKETKILDVVER